MLRARRRGAELSVGFDGTRVGLVARGSRRSGRIELRVAGRSRVVDLRETLGYRRVVFRSRVLRPGRHVLRVRTLDGGVADVDAFGVRAGPSSPER